MARNQESLILGKEGNSESLKDAAKEKSLETVKPGDEFLARTLEELITTLTVLGEKDFLDPKTVEEYVNRIGMIKDLNDGGAPPEAWEIDLAYLPDDLAEKVKSIVLSKEE